MLLKSLELQGFKTFPDKTTLTFDRGITAVVGPNGSGKSNISDAVRWVLGEQSTRVLRCTKMEDVVFSGTTTRKAQGYAEVTLTIDNTTRDLPFDHDTVAITRRYYRSGNSEYLINKVMVRLKDINELFMDTGLGRDGYSMIGQGKIDSIVAARSEDRREIFEEAAGISRYRYRKQESERRLAQTEENLVRLRDILAELESRVGPLKEQAEKAERYLEYAGEKRTLEIGLWLNTLDKSGHILREHDDKIVIARAQHDEIGAELDAINERIETNFSDMNACTVRADEYRAQASQKEEMAVRKDGEVSVLENDILHHKQTIERLQNEMESSAVSGQEIDAEIQKKQEEYQQKELEIKQKNEEFITVTQDLESLRSGMNQSSDEMEGYTAKLAELSARNSDIKVEDMTAASSISEITMRCAAVDETLTAKRAQQEELLQAQDALKQMLSDLDQRIASLGNTVRGYEMRMDSRKKRVDAAKQQSDKLRLDAEERRRRAKLLEELERNLEGFTKSVKVVMQESSHGRLSGIHGPVSRLIHVPRQYAVAIETALGASMQNIVVGEEQDAKRAIQMLKQKDGGRATFLPLSTIKGNVLNEKGLDDCVGFVGVAGRLCSCEQPYNGIRDSLLGRIVVAEDLDSAVSIARKYQYRFRVVTLDGQVVNAGGSLTGGSFARNSGLLSRQGEIEQFQKEAEELEGKFRQSLAELKVATQEAAGAEAALSAARGELITAQEERVRVAAEQQHTASSLEEAGAAVAELEQERKTASARLLDLQAVRKKARESAEQLEKEIAQLQDTIGALSGNREELNQRCEQLSAHLQEIRLAGLSAKKDQELVLRAVEELKRQKEGCEDRNQELRREIENVEKANAQILTQIETLRTESEQLRKEAQESRAGIEQENEKRMHLEALSVQLRAQEREKSSARETVGHDLARLEERKANLQKEYDEIIKKLWEEYELTRREAEEVATKIEDATKAQRRLNELKSKIRNLGSVNVAAVEEYKEVSQRYEFLNKQVSDVERSRSELLKMIGDLTHQMRELFVVRFQKISEQFVLTFRELFGGGNASLALSDPEDILNSGIDITVQPPGKIVKHLESLSGGEKALVAISLYFAIMKVSPPPFCMLDEIEAALDDVNVDRFSSYLRRMTDNTQFIAITHRRGTMEEADVLYGVTMQDEGVSKLLELRASEIEQKLGRIG